MSSSYEAPYDAGNLPIVPETLMYVDARPYPVDINKPNALSRALQPEYAGLNPNDYADITRNMVTYAKPERFRNYLIGVPRPTSPNQQPCVISYYAGKMYGELQLAVTPDEAKRIPRSIGAIRRAAEITTAATVTTPFPTDADLDRGRRSGRHVHEQKLDVLRKFNDNVYDPQLRLLDKFAEAANGRHFGLARFSNEGAMRQAMAELQTYIFGDIARAYGRQRNLSENQTKQFERSIAASIYYDRINNNHLRNFSEMIKFSKEYISHKSAAVQQRIESIELQLSRDV